MEVEIEHAHCSLTVLFSFARNVYQFASTQAIKKPSVVILPFPVAKDIQDTIGCVCMDEHVLTVAFELVEKRWSVSRANNEHLPTEASPRVTDFSIEPL